MARPINIHDQYRFFYDHPVNGETQCYPAIDSVVTEWFKEEGQMFYRKQISQNFVFINNAKREITDFTDLYELDRSDDNRCKKIDFRIEIKCGDDWEEWYLGYIALVDGEFDVDRCVLSVPIRTSDKYACIENIFDEDVNVLEIESEEVGDHWEVETIVLFFDYGVISSTHLENPEFPDPPAGSPIFEKGYVDFPMINRDLWNIVDNKIRFYELTDPPDPSKPWAFEITTIWQSWVVFTECDNGTPTDPGGGDWVLLDDCRLTSNSEEGFTKWRKSILSTTTRPPRGRRFEDVVQMLIEPCGLKLESYLFSAGGVGDKPDNDVYNWAEDNLRYLTFHQITDIVKKPINEVDFATRGDLNLSDLLDDLAALEIYWDIDENDNFILEHISYFLNESLMLDLTEEERKKYIQGKHKYKYVDEELPRIENFEWLVQGERKFETVLSALRPGQGRTWFRITVAYNELAFDAGKIVYDNACGDPEANTSYRFKTFVTNLADVLENPENYPDELFVLVASNDQGEVITRDVYPGNNIIPGSYQERNRINAPLTLGDLVYYLMRWNRPQKTGELVDANLTLNMTHSKRLIEQEEITFPICCTDLINTFDPADLVRTQLGWGEVADVNYSDPSGIMTITLRHR